MKGIYFTTMCDINDLNDTSNLGIKEKIRKQINVFEKNGISIFFYCAHSNKKYYKYYNRLPFYKDNFKLPVDVIRKADFIYLRKPSTINMGFIELLKSVRKENSRIKILLEVPTYPYDKEIKGLIRLPLKIKDRIACSKLCRYVDVVLTYSNDEEIFKIPTIRLSNGVDVKQIADSLQNYPCLADDKIRMMACAKFNLWHGYDRVIEGLNQYVQKTDSNKNIEIEFVGDGLFLNKYKEMVEKYQLQKYVVFHGKCQGTKLTEIYSKCVIGLDSMGRHRSGVYYNSSLKGKEYCAYGLVVVSGVETELDHDELFDYYLRVPANDSPVDFSEVINFYYDVTQEGERVNEVKDRIRRYASEKFDMEVVFKPVIDYIKNREKK